MAESAATDLLDELTANTDSLAAALQPLFAHPLSATASALPPLDKAKLYTLTTYAIESILLAYERISASSNPNEYNVHPVMMELKRVQHYMQKIDRVENPEKYAEKEREEKDRALTLDKGAAGRIVKHGLAGNERFDKLRAGREELARQEAKRKLEAVAGDAERKKKKKPRRSAESVLDVQERNLELVKGSITQNSAETSGKDKPRKKQRKSKDGGEGT